MVAFAHGAHGLLARRVDDAHQRQQREARLHVGKRQAAAGRRGALAGQCQQAQPLRCGVGGHAAPGVHVQRVFAVVRQLGAAHVQNALGRALGKNPRVAVAVAVPGGHEAVLRLERDRIEPGPALLALRLGEPRLAAQHQQRALGGVAHHRPQAVFLVQAGIVAQHTGAHGQGQCRVVRDVDDAAIDAAVAHRGVAHAAHVEHMARAHHALHGHLVACQRAGLVGADHRDRAQRLDGGQAADDGVAPGHALHAQRQRHGHDGGQPLGDGRRRQGHDHHEHLGWRVAAHPGAQHKGERGYAQNDQRQHPAKAVHLAQERRGQALDAREHLVDLAQLGGAGRGHHDARGLAGHHQGARIGHALAVAQRGIQRDGVGGFLGCQ